ncbi:MAG TPA: GIY-YIG nuclease family protein, partial [Nitrospinaceae bacterium]|nr:GIY-YIG nuclease family protein [Nitrospinaceae bacterium]
MALGYLYIITNKSWLGWIKIGTTRNLKTRLQTYQTGSPFRDYEVIYSIRHPEYLQAEKNIKEQMSRFAKRIKNEWYEVDLEVAKARLSEQLDNYFYGECDYSQSYPQIKTLTKRKKRA